MSQTAAASARLLSWLRPRAARGAESTLVTLEPQKLATHATLAPAPMTPREIEGETLRWLDAETHARLLCHVLYLGERPCAPGNILARDLRVFYDDLCAELGLVPHAYQIVSNLVRRQLGPVKTYCWHVAEDGKRSRLRVFKFLRIRPCVLTDEEQMLIAPLRQ